MIIKLVNSNNKNKISYIKEIVISNIFFSYNKGVKLYEIRAL